MNKFQNLVVYILRFCSRGAANDYQIFRCYKFLPDSLMQLIAGQVVFVNENWLQPLRYTYFGLANRRRNMIIRELML